MSDTQRIHAVAMAIREPADATVHDLKTLPEHFAAVWRGDKKAEVRHDDRNFREGDFVRLREILHGEKDAPVRYTGRMISARISHVLRGYPNVRHGYVVISLADPVNVATPRP